MITSAGSPAPGVETQVKRLDQKLNEIEAGDKYMNMVYRPKSLSNEDSLNIAQVLINLWNDLFYRPAINS
jgi:hypothetical protein